MVDSERGPRRPCRASSSGRRHPRRRRRADLPRRADRPRRSTASSLDVAPGRGRRPHRPQRLRQEHAPARPRPGLHRARPRARSPIDGEPVDRPGPERSGSCSRSRGCSRGGRRADNVRVPARARRLAAAPSRPPARPSCSASSARREVAGAQAVDAVGRHAPAGGDRARARARARGPAARRAVQRPRRPDPRAAQRGAARRCGPGSGRRSCSSPTASPRRCSSPTGSIVLSPRPGRVVADIAVGPAAAAPASTTSTRRAAAGSPPGSARTSSADGEP